MSDKIYEGWFFKAFHYGDNGRKMRHPFLAIGISKNKVVALQFSSVKYDKNGEYESYFSSDEEKQLALLTVDIGFGKIKQFTSFSNIVEVDTDHGLEYHSEANINLLHVFNFSNSQFHKFELLEECVVDKWWEIIEKLQNFNWEDDFRNEMVQQWNIN